MYVCKVYFTMLLEINGPKHSSDDETLVNVSKSANSFMTNYCILAIPPKI